MKNLREIFRLPKWAKISLIALSAIAFSLLVAVFALQSWADSKVESANLTFSKIDKAKSADLENAYAYEARVHFARLEFLLRSKSISKINIENIAWSGVDSSAITSYESHNNRRVKFTTTQNLNLDSGSNLGIMSYKMDFSPLPTAIIWYYLWIVFAVLFASLMLSFGKAQSGALLGGGERTFASNPTLSPCQISQIALFASLYLLFFTLNFIFPTQSDDLGAGFGGLGAAYKSYMTWNGRLGDLTRLAFGSYLAHTPLYPFINALLGVAFIYLFFILIFARLPFMGDCTSDSRVDSHSHSHDISVICFILICLFAFKGFGSVFYWAAGSFNYLWAWVIIMAWCVPFRLFWGEILAKDSRNFGESKADSSESSTKSHIFPMLILGLIAGWGSEFGIVLIVFQIALIAFALQKRVQLPLWYYVGVAGFIAGWLILYLSPGHAARGNIVNALNNDTSFVTIGELLAMPVVDIFKRFAGTFSKDPMGLTWIAVVGLLAFLRFGLNMQKRIVAIVGIVLLVAYAVPITKFIFVILVGILCLWGGFALKRTNPQSANRTYLFALCGLFVAYFLATAATIQVGVPARAKLPYLLLGMAQVIIAWLLLKPYLARFSKMICVCVCAVCGIYALFVVSESATMRIKWERMLASIEAQKALGQTSVNISAETFRSNYRGYGDWGNPTQNTNAWPNTTYAKVFGVKKFVVREY